MRSIDQFGFAFHALRGHQLRTGLMLLAMAIGVTCVIVLTSLGEGARRFVKGEFVSLGTHMLIVLPGRSETTGGHPPIMGETPRDLTIDDALALLRSPAVRRVTPIIVGAVPVSYGGLEREVTLLGTTADFVLTRKLTIAQGRNLPAGEIRKPKAVGLLGSKIRDELFGGEAALGQWVRVGDRRFRVIGVLKSEGRSIGVDVEELVLIPVAAAESLLNTTSLFRVLVEARSRDYIEPAKEDIVRIIRDRHEGEDDVTVITQDAVIATFDKVLRALTYTLAGIAAISLLVAGILIMNVMLIAVSQRRAEIGLLKALGASPARIQALFLYEAAIMSLVGALIGLLLGFVLAYLIGEFYPALDMRPPVWIVIAALGVSLGSGLVFGLLPARRAAGLQPVEALSGR